MVDWELVKKLIETVKKENITGLAVEEKGVKYEVRMENGKVISSHVAAPIPVPNPTLSSLPEAEEEGVVAILSPMVGTFYRAPSPESPAFVEAGDEIEAGRVVCIIEAMKLFNEIEAEVKGKLVKVLVENGQPVEYGQKLMLLKKA